MTAFGRSRTLLALISSVGLLSVSGGALFAATQYSAKTDWTVSSDAAQGYCTAVQGFSNDAVITIAQRPDDAISVAFDFQKAVFDTSKNYTAKITANNTSRTFTTRTASATALVIAVGIDDAFFDALKSSKNLALNVDGKDYSFSMGNASAGLSALKPCLAALNGQGTTQVASAAPASAPTSTMSASAGTSASNASSLAEENASLKAALADMRRNYENLSSQAGSSARTIELEEKLAQAQSEIRALEAKASATPAPAPTPAAQAALPGAEAAAQMAALQDEVNALKTERDQLKTQIQTAPTGAPVAEEVTQIKNEMARQVNELNAQISGLKQQNAALNASLETAKAAPAVPAVDPAKEAQITALQNEKTALAAQIQQLNAANAKLTGDLTQAKTGDVAATQEVATLKAQLAQLTAQNASLAQAASQKGEADASSAAQIGQLNAKLVQLENEKAALQGTVAGLNKQVADLSAAAATPAAAPAADTSALTAQISTLQTQNAALQAEITNLNTQLASAGTTESTDAGEAEDLRDQLRVSRADVDRLLAENAKLTQDISTLQNASAQESASMASGDWNLEQATRRYQESQREIRRLGSLLEQQRGKCDQEKKDIEYMLFDPKLTEEGQISVLNSLEDQLDVAQNRVRELEGKYNEPATLMPPRPNIAAAYPASASSGEVAAIPAVAGSPVRAGAIASAPTSVSVTRGIPDQNYFQTLLSNANVNFGNLAEAPEAPGSYTWVVDNSLYGTAKESPLTGSFQNMVDAYISNVKSRCDGEFASVPVSTGNANPGNARQAYEIACVDGKGGLSASLLFYQYGNTFISIAHEGATDRMENAMEVRDRLDKAVQTSS
ncbi:MAG: hypothetical protein AB7E85_02135 [Pseudobdellovibrionaceae bacterium]